MFRRMVNLRESLVVVSISLVQWGPFSDCARPRPGSCLFMMQEIRCRDLALNSEWRTPKEDTAERM